MQLTFGSGRFSKFGQYVAMTMFNQLVGRIIRSLLLAPPFRGRLFLAGMLIRLVSVAPSYYGPLIRVRHGDWTNQAILFGYYGDEIADYVRALGKDDVFVDIGANVGLFSILANRARRVYAFEPNSAVYADLLNNIALNERENIVPLNLALSDRSMAATLETRPDHSGASYLRETGNGPVVIAVAAKALPLLDEDGSFAIKIDVEGHELQVLRGLDEAGWLERAKWVIVEISDTQLARHDSTVDEAYELMNNVGFVPRKGKRDGHYDEFFEPVN